MPLKLILEVPSQLLQTDPEQIFHEITGKSDAFVGVVILIVWIAVGDGHF